MRKKISSPGVAHVAHAQGEDEAVQGDLSPGVDGGHEVADRGLAIAVTLAQRRQRRLIARQAEDVGRLLDQTFLEEGLQLLLAQALDIDFQQLMGPTWPLRSFESLVTAVYQYEVRAGWTLQPNFQYFVHPGGGATNPTGSNPGRLLKDAAVFGLRTVLKF